jgi:hypothetical protein
VTAFLILPLPGILASKSEVRLSHEVEEIAVKDCMTIRISASLLKASTLMFPVVPIVCFLSLKHIDYDVYMKIVHEDSVVEYVTSGLYLLSAALAVSISVNFVRKRRTVLGASYIFLACGLFFAFGEEISWGQRVLGIGTPEFLLKHSSQGEINVHNLYPIQAILHKIYILIGVYGSFLWLITLLGTKKLRSFVHRYFIPGWYLMSYFLPVLLFYVYYDYIKPYSNILDFTWREQEPAEFILSIGFFLFLLVNRFRQIEELHLSEPHFFRIGFREWTSARSRIPTKKPR